MKEYGSRTEPTFWQKTQGHLFPRCLQRATLHEPHLLHLGPVNCQVVLISTWMVSLILPTTSVLLTADQGIIQAPVWELGKLPRLSGSPSHLKESEDLAKLGE